jgi:hypothetical protein
MAPSNLPNPAAVLAEYWGDDFRPLESAGKAVLRAMREDEAASDADLFRKVTENNGKHLYFSAQDQIAHKKSIPLPPVIVDAMAQAKHHSFMGILAQASMVWATSDEKLFLWSFETEGVHSFQASEPIITVGLVKPTEGECLPRKCIVHCACINTHMYLYFSFRRICGVGQVDTGSNHAQ